jgi:hypothetical protein
MADNQDKRFIEKHSHLLGFIVCFLIAYAFIYIPIWQLVIIPDLLEDYSLKKL